MRSKFDEQLKQLHIDLLDMAYLIQDAIQNAMIYFFEADINGAKKIIKNDENVNHYQKKIENICFNLLIQQQPVAKDLRIITAALKMVTDMERIGDQAADVAEILSFLSESRSEATPILIGMAKAAMKMVTESVDAFVKRDIMLAEKVVADDDAVDGYFIAVKHSLIDEIAKTSEQGEHALDLLMIAKYFERIGDHAVNIAHWVIFSITGEHRREHNDLVR